MQSSNPVFKNSEGFNGRGQAATDPSQWQINLDASATPTHTGTGTGEMTLDKVVEKTALLLGTVTAVAAATWFLIGGFEFTDNGVYADNGAESRLMLFSMVGIVATLVLSLVNSFKKKVSPPLIMAYAVAEGIFVGAISKAVAVFVVGDSSIVFQAVLATLVTFGVVLAAYKFGNIRVTAKFRKIVVLATMAAAGVMIVNLLLSLFGVFDQGGLRGFNTLGLLVSLVMVVLAVFNLVLDFDFVERGIEARLPAVESWRAAFGLTVTIVWLYIELLRILAILRGND